MKQILLDKGQRVAAHLGAFSGKKGAVPLVLLHGFCEDSSLWNGMTVALGDIPVLAIDLPGFGQSDLPEHPDMPTYAAAVCAVLDALEIEKCVLVGHSLGGYVALEFAAQAGERLAGLGLFHSHPFPDNEERKLARLRGIEMLQSGKRDLYVAQLFPNLFSPAFAAARPEVVSALIATGKTQSAAGIAAALTAMMNRADQQSTLAEASCPVLFLLGEEDNLVPVAQAWQMAVLPASASVEIMPGVAHMGMFEAPEKSAEALRLFWRWCCL